MKRLLVFTDWFAPGFEAGGPVQSCVNFCKSMASRYEIFVVTRNTDLCSRTPYSLAANQWCHFSSNVRVFYASHSHRSFFHFSAIQRRLSPDYVYFNSMFSPQFTLAPLLTNLLLRSGPTFVLAPRGMLEPSALAHKRLKKKVFLALFRSAGLARHIHFQATNEDERENIRKCLGESVRTSVAPNWPTNPVITIKSKVKQRGEARLISVARIHPIKNIHRLLTELGQCRATVSLDLFGIAEDAHYWRQCLQLAEQLPDNVHFRYRLGQTPEAILQQLDSYHFFILPTAGENFGHAIFDALGRGVPAIISNQTPWRDLPQQQAGWDLSLNERGTFAKTVDECAAMEQSEYDEWSRGAHSFSKAQLDSLRLEHAYSMLFPT